MKTISSLRTFLILIILIYTSKTATLSHSDIQKSQFKAAYHYNFIKYLVNEMENNRNIEKNYKLITLQLQRLYKQSQILQMSFLPKFNTIKLKDNDQVILGQENNYLKQIKQVIKSFLNPNTSDQLKKSIKFWNYYFIVMKFLSYIPNVNTKQVQDVLQASQNAILIIETLHISYKDNIKTVFRAITKTLQKMIISLNDNPTQTIIYSKTICEKLKSISYTFFKERLTLFDTFLSQPLNVMISRLNDQRRQQNQRQFQKYIKMNKQETHQKIKADTEQTEDQDNTWFWGIGGIIAITLAAVLASTTNDL